MKRIFPGFIFLAGLFAAGLVFRIYIASLVPQPWAFDQMEYRGYAVRILHDGLAASPARLYGYPMFLAVLYRIFGTEDFESVFLAQAAADSLTAILIYGFVRMSMKSEKAALVSSVLYAFNPFTAVYTRVMLTEQLAAFLVMSVFFLSFIALKRNRAAYYFVTALTAAYLVMVRPSLLLFSVGVAVILGIRIFRTPSRNLPAFICLIAGFLTPFAYSLAGNMKVYRQPAFLTVDNLFVRELYISLFTERSPRYAADISVFPEEIRDLYQEYSTVPGNSDERKQMAAKYFGRAVAKIRNDPVSFVRTRLLKMWYVWEKHFLFYYREPVNPFRDKLVYGINLALLGSAAMGLIFWTRGVFIREDGGGRYAAVMAGLLLLTVTVGHAFSLAEERYSLPAYPVVYVLAGYFLTRIRTGLPSTRAGPKK